MTVEGRFMSSGMRSWLAVMLGLSLFSAVAWWVVVVTGRGPDSSWSVVAAVGLTITVLIYAMRLWAGLRWATASRGSGGQG